jgi:hypothetical protein
MDMVTIAYLLNKIKTIPKGDKGDTGDPGIDATVVDHKLVVTKNEQGSDEL